MLVKMPMLLERLNESSQAHFVEKQSLKHDSILTITHDLLCATCFMFYTVIWITDLSSIQMVKNSYIVKWSVFQSIILIIDKITLYSDAIWIIHCYQAFE